jgi:hypothetical protein
MFIDGDSVSGISRLWYDEAVMKKTARPSSMRDAFAVLNQMRDKGIFEKYAVGGAVAASILMEPMTTADIDIFVTLKAPEGSKLISLEPLYNFLLKKGAKKEGQYIVYAGWPLQFLPADTSPLVAEALANAQEFEADNISVYIFNPEYLAAVALETGRPKDKYRLLALVESGILNTKALLVILNRHGLERRYREWVG